MMLKVNEIHTYYGLSHILFGVSLGISQKEIVFILGRNGAGKSTTMRSIMGLNPPRRGTIEYKGKIINRQKPHVLSRQGMTYVPDDRRVFADLTVKDNLEISQSKGGHWNEERVYDVFPVLKSIRRRKAGFLSGGEQQMLTIARALVTNPDLLLLDEPSEGLAPIIVEEIEQQIIRLKDSGMSILIAEQNIESALKVSTRGYIIDNGVIRYEGSTNDLKDNEGLRNKYLLV